MRPLLPVLALVLALSGTAYGAATLRGADVRDASLTGADLRNRSVTGADVRNRSLRAADLAASALPRAAAGAAGPPGPEGPGGEAGPAGARGDKGASGDRGRPAILAGSTAESSVVRDLSNADLEVVSGSLALPGTATLTLRASARLVGQPETSDSVACTLRVNGVPISQAMNQTLAPDGVVTVVATAAASARTHPYALACRELTGGATFRRGAVVVTATPLAGREP